MSRKTHILHIARLKNNCPTCGGTNGLELTFTQDEKENAFLHRPNPKIDDRLFCHNCKNPIYPVNWTEDIERVYDYNKKIAESHRKYLKVNPLLYILIFAAIILVAATLYIFGFKE